MASPRIAIIIYTMYGHIGKSTFLFFFRVAKHWIHGIVVAESVKAGIVARGGNTDILQ